MRYRSAAQAVTTTTTIQPTTTTGTIARDELAKASGGGSGEPTNQEVAEYVERVREANRHRLVSGDPDLIYPGETIVLPPVD
jgi:hypothetical protein